MLAFGVQTSVAARVTSPDGSIVVKTELKEGCPFYMIYLEGEPIMDWSPLGLVMQGGVDMTKDMTEVDSDYSNYYRLDLQDRIKTDLLSGSANEMSWTLADRAGRRLRVMFRVSDSDVAFRYEIPVHGDTRSARVMREATGFRMQEGTTTFLTPQSEAMTGWKRTKPSYEEEYQVDVPMDVPSRYGHGYTFPCLFKVADLGWLLISETGVDSRYCGSHLSDCNERLYTISFPMTEENNGNGTVEPAFALPGFTPWRTITLGRTLAPIVETTVAWDYVEPKYEASRQYEPGRSAWSWILWQDESINLRDQKAYVDMAQSLGWEYILVDNWWDSRIGREGIRELVDYASERNIGVMLWYSSSGWWNDIEQGPVNVMDNAIERKREMAWMRDLGVKGIKVDFFGGDKQETMRLYEGILSDANDAGLSVIFHGCTLPRGWERMYPNYVGSEAVLASENLIFTQHACDTEAFNATLHPFMRNSVGSMDFGGSFLNHRMNRGNDGGNVRVTTDAFSLATAILYQTPVQNFALAPNNLEDAPEICIEFMKEVPTIWSDIKFIEGYPGSHVVLGRKHSGRWYVAGVNATTDIIRTQIELPEWRGIGNTEAEIITDDKHGRPIKKKVKVNADGKTDVEIRPQGGFVIKY